VDTIEAGGQRRRGVCCQLPETADEGWAVSRAQVLRALADPVRLSMVAALARASAPVCVCDFTAAYRLTQPTISHHMAKLKEAGLVEASKHGLWTYYRLRSDLPDANRRLLDSVLS
jgi:ArsR family transcriptional regulator